MRVGARIRKDVSDETVRCLLRGAVYRLLYPRKKGLLKWDDLKKVRKFARKVTKILIDKFWEEGISFYIDAAELQHKYNPDDEARSIRIRAWRL